MNIGIIGSTAECAINFRKDLLAGERFDVAFNRAEASFQDWKSQIDS